MEAEFKSKFSNSIFTLTVALLLASILICFCFICASVSPKSVEDIQKYIVELNPSKAQLAQKVVAHLDRIEGVKKGQSEIISSIQAKNLVADKLELTASEDSLLNDLPVIIKFKANDKFDPPVLEDYLRINIPQSKLHVTSKDAQLTVNSSIKLGLSKKKLWILLLGLIGLLTLAFIGRIRYNIKQSKAMLAALSLYGADHQSLRKIIQNNWFKAILFSTFLGVLLFLIVFYLILYPLNYRFVDISSSNCIIYITLVFVGPMLYYWILSYLFNRGSLNHL